MAEESKVRVNVGAVSETMLWTLYERATEAQRPDAIICDPWAIELVNSIDFPFIELFGNSNSVLAQLQALRVQCFDREISEFLVHHPEGTVVALGEGLETQFWRVDNGSVRWLSVDLPEVVNLRKKLLPTHQRITQLGCSVLDFSWLEQVDASRGVLLTAQGLLMYLPPHDVRNLLWHCADRFPGQTFIFDAMPLWFTRLASRGEIKTPGGYQAPPMPWGMDVSQQSQLLLVHPNISQTCDVRPEPGRGFLFHTVLPRVNHIPVVRDKRPSIVRLNF